MPQHHRLKLRSPSKPLTSLDERWKNSNPSAFVNCPICLCQPYVFNVAMPDHPCVQRPPPSGDLLQRLSRQLSAASPLTVLSPQSPHGLGERLQNMNLQSPRPSSTQCPAPSATSAPRPCGPGSIQSTRSSGHSSIQSARPNMPSVAQNSRPSESSEVQSPGPIVHSSAESVGLVTSTTTDEPDLAQLGIRQIKKGSLTNVFEARYVLHVRVCGYA